jgi:hypothetical protein
LPYKLVVIDHWQVPHEDAAHELPEVYDSLGAAIAEAQRMLDRQIRLEPGETAEEFLEIWLKGGEDVLVASRGDPAPPPAGFRGHAYVKERATVLYLASEWARWAEHGTVG